MKRDQAAGQFRRAMQMFAQTLSDDQAMEVATVYPEYKVGKAYKTGEMFTDGQNKVGDPQLYRVVQDHTSQADWVPASTPSLYTPIGLTDDGYPIWSQPTGAHDAYNTGDIVEHSGELYESLVDGNVWEPGAVGAENVWKVAETE